MRILVTHGLGFLPQCDKIIVMVEGKITEVGTYEELLEQDQAFAEYLRNYGSKEENNEDQESSEKRDIPFNILLLIVCFTDQYPASLPVTVMCLIAVHT